MLQSIDQGPKKCESEGALYNYLMRWGGASNATRGMARFITDPRKTPHGRVRHNILYSRRSRRSKARRVASRATQYLVTLVEPAASVGADVMAELVEVDICHRELPLVSDGSQLLPLV